MLSRLAADLEHEACRFGCYRALIERLHPERMRAQSHKDEGAAPRKTGQLLRSLFSLRLGCLCTQCLPDFHFPYQHPDGAAEGRGCRDRKQVIRNAPAVAVTRNHAPQGIVDVLNMEFHQFQGVIPTQKRKYLIGTLETAEGQTTFIFVSQRRPRLTGQRQQYALACAGKRHSKGPVPQPPPYLRYRRPA